MKKVYIPDNFMKDQAIRILRERAPTDVLDYGFVMDCLRDYKVPRANLTKLIKSGNLIRVKKGIYTYGDAYRKGAYPLESLANIIYGPSYVSLEWALQFHGLIPEAVNEVTSVTR